MGWSCLLAEFTLVPGVGNNGRPHIVEVWRNEDGAYSYTAYERWGNDGDRTAIALTEEAISFARRATEVWAEYWDRYVAPELEAAEQNESAHDKSTNRGA